MLTQSARFQLPKTAIWWTRLLSGMLLFSTNWGTMAYVHILYVQSMEGILILAQYSSKVLFMLGELFPTAAQQMTLGGEHNHTELTPISAKAAHHNLHKSIMKQGWNKHHIKVLHSYHNTISCKTHTTTISIKTCTNRYTTANHMLLIKHKLLQQLTCPKNPPCLRYLQGQLPTSSSLRLEGEGHFCPQDDWVEPLKEHLQTISTSRRKPRNLVSVLVLYSSSIYKKLSLTCNPPILNSQFRKSRVSQLTNDSSRGKFRSILWGISAYHLSGMRLAVTAIACKNTIHIGGFPIYFIVPGQVHMVLHQHMFFSWNKWGGFFS